MCFYQSPFDDTFIKGDSVALAVQNKKSIKIPATSTYSADIHNAILWMLTPNRSLRPHVIQILEQFRDMHNKPNGVS